MNTVVVSGVIGKEPVVNASGKIASVSLAVTDKLRGADGKAQTSWVNLKVLGEKKVATIQKYWSKGTKLLVHGSLDFKSVKSDNGYKKYDYVLVESWEFMGGKKDNDDADDDFSAGSKADSDGFMEVPKGMDIDAIFS